MNSETYLTIAGWFDKEIRENKGYNSKIRYVTVVWGAIRRILHINYNYIKFQSVNLQSRTGSRPTSGTTYICRASKSPPPGSQKPLLSLCNSTRTWRSSILDLSQPSKRQVDGGCGKDEGIWSIIRNISTSRRLVNITKQFRKLGSLVRMSIPPHAGYGRITLLLLSKVIPTMIHDEYLKMIKYVHRTYMCIVTMMSMSTRTNKNAEISRKWHFKLNHQKNNLQCGQSPGDLRSLFFLLPKIPGCRRFHTTLQQMVWGHQMLLVPCIRRPTANSNQQPSRPSKFYRKGEKTQIDATGVSEAINIKWKYKEWSCWIEK